MVRQGVSAPPRHDAWIDPASEIASPRSDGGALLAMIAIYAVGVVLTCWFLFVA
jgi:hypothetical protein